MSSSSTCSASDPINLGRTAFLQVKQGTDYYIVAGASTMGAANFTLSCIPQTYDLANDECAGAISVTDGVTTYNNDRATNQQTPSFNAPYRDVWFRFASSSLPL